MLNRTRSTLPDSYMQYQLHYNSSIQSFYHATQCQTGTPEKQVFTCQNQIEIFAPTGKFQYYHFLLFTKMTMEQTSLLGPTAQEF